MPKTWRFTEDQKQELERLLRTHSKPHVRRKALALVHLTNGKTASEAASAVRTHRVSVGSWAQRYLRAGVKGLEVADGRGRPSAVRADEVGSYLRQSPRVFGIDLTRWSLSALAEVVPCLKGMSPAGVKKALERCGFAYKRGQPYLHSPDLEYGAKKGQWMKL